MMLLDAVDPIIYPPPFIIGCMVRVVPVSMNVKEEYDKSTNPNAQL